MARPESIEMKQALDAITAHKVADRLEPPRAAEKFGVRLNSIYRKARYKAWRAKQLAREAAKQAKSKP